MQGIYDAAKSVQDFLNMQSIGSLIVVLVLTFFLGKIVGALLRALSRFVRRRADKSENLSSANWLRRAETWIILSVAIVQVALVIAAVYIWWNSTHPHGSATSSGALIGVSALAAILIGGVTGPLLRDLVFGASMMAEHWYGVGDVIAIDFPKVRGVVEAVSLRSTKIRGINGETVWIANSSIQGVSVARRGLMWMAVELFVNDVKKAEQLIADTNTLLPTGSTLMAEKLTITKVDARAQDIWHITAVAGVAPGREWIIETAAMDIIKKLDEKNKKPALVTDPVQHFDDHEAEKELRRAVRNARKPQKKFEYTALTPTQIATRAKKSYKQARK